MLRTNLVTYRLKWSTTCVRWGILKDRDPSGIAIRKHMRNSKFRGVEWFNFDEFHSYTITQNLFSVEEALLFFTSLTLNENE